MKWVIANWKMQGTRASVSRLLQGIVDFVPSLGLPDDAPGGLVLCPSLVHLELASSILSKSPMASKVALGAQNVAHQLPGAVTGETAIEMLVDLGVRFVLIGHSERRQGGESTELLRLKLEALGKRGTSITPIYCVGESERRNEKAARSILTQQLATLKAGWNLAQPFLLAYEPVWCIGTGQTPEPDVIEATHQWLVETLGRTVPILYGGSVGARNARDILQLETVAGVLVGGASWDLEAFKSLVAAAASL